MPTTTTGKIARQLSRELRKNPTPSERLLWNAIKNRKFLNLKFLRQHPIFYLYDDKRNFFIADFYCHQVKIVIELDGKIHDYQKNYDQLRTEFLEYKNIVVIRFTNDEIISDLKNVLKKLEKFIRDRNQKIETGDIK